MGRFGVYRHRQSSGFLLDCQADILSGLPSRFVVPLLPLDEAPPVGLRLNPVFSIDGVQVSMVTQFAGAVPNASLGHFVVFLEEEQSAIMNALDMLMTGY